MKFTIDEIIAGWLNVTFDFGECVYCIMATDIHKTDSAYQLMEMACNALKNDSEYYAVLDNEPGAWVIMLSGTGKAAVYLSREDLFGKAELEGCDLAFETHTDVYDFAEQIYTAFEKYSEGDGLAEYENEWMPFPHELFNKLGYALGKTEK